MSRDRRRGTWTMTGAALFLLGAALSIDPSRLRRGPPLDGEAGQAVAAYSLAGDNDLRYDRQDLEEAAALFGGVPTELTLARTASGELRYVASGLEPWLVSWLLPWLGPRSFPTFHSLALVAAAVLAWWGAGGRSARDAAWILTALTASALPIWLFRFTPEAYRAALVLAGAAMLAPRPSAEIEDPWTMRPDHGLRAARAVAGGAILGLATWELGPSGAWLGLVPFATMPQTMGSERRRLVLAHALLAFAVLVSVAVTLHLAPLSRLRSLDPWRHPRETRTFTTPLPREDGHDFAAVGDPLPAPPGGVSDPMRAYALRDAFVGRFSGAMWWYPCAGIAVLAVAVRRPRPWRLALATIAVAGLAAHALTAPFRMAGPGDGAGPSVAAPFYALMVVAGAGAVGLRSLVAAWTAAGFLLGEPLTNPLAAVREPALHARSLPYTLFPLDVSRIGHWPGGRTVGRPAPDGVLIDVRENVDVVISPCDLREVTSPIGGACLWTPAEDVAEILVWLARPSPPSSVVVRAGPVPTTVTLSVGPMRVVRNLEATEVATVGLDGVGEGFPAALDGREGWAWIVRVRSDRAFQPALAGAGRDRHWLGAEVGIPGVPG